MEFLKTKCKHKHTKIMVLEVTATIEKTATVCTNCGKTIKTSIDI